MSVRPSVMSDLRGGKWIGMGGGERGREGGREGVGGREDGEGREKERKGRQALTACCFCRFRLEIA